MSGYLVDGYCPLTKEAIAFAEKKLTLLQHTVELETSNVKKK
jgi:hypothetical protein